MPAAAAAFAVKNCKLRTNQKSVPVESNRGEYETFVTQRNSSRNAGRCHGIRPERPRPPGATRRSRHDGAVWRRSQSDGCSETAGASDLFGGASIRAIRQCSAQAEPG